MFIELHNKSRLKKKFFLSYLLSYLLVQFPYDVFLIMLLWDILMYLFRYLLLEDKQLYITNYK